MVISLKLYLKGTLHLWCYRQQSFVCPQSVSIVGLTILGYGISGSGFTARFSLPSISWIHINWWSAGQVLQCWVYWHNYMYLEHLHLYNIIVWLYIFKTKKVVVIDSFSNLWVFILKLWTWGILHFLLCKMTFPVCERWNFKFCFMDG